MRPTPNLLVEKFRIRSGQMASSRFDGNNGAFALPGGIRVIASDGGGWDHVSVSLAARCPTWGEMCRVKDLFFLPDECVVQFHPRHSEYVNYHEFCLHLWRCQDAEFPTPDTAMVGPLTTGEKR